jgi:hypothetical protein
VVNQNGTPVGFATITVYDQGTANTSTLYSDDGSTVLANPLTADAQGNFYFYPEDGRYDIVLSGGSPPINSYTISDLEISDTKGEPPVWAHMYAGDNLGAKINAADAALGSVFGRILVDKRAGTTSSEQITISSGHVLEFVEPGIYTFDTAGILMENGASIVGAQAGQAGGTTSEAATKLYKTYAGTADDAFIDYYGSDFTHGGGRLDNLAIINGAGDNLTNAVRIQATGVSNAPSWVWLNRLDINADSSVLRWKRNLHIDGSGNSGTANGTRDHQITLCRFLGAGTDDENVTLNNAQNVFISGSFVQSGNNGAQTPGWTLTGASGSETSNTRMLGCSGGNLVLSWSQNTTIHGGGFVDFTTTSGETQGDNLVSVRDFSGTVTNGANATTVILAASSGNLRSYNNFRIPNNVNIQSELVDATGKNLISIDASDRYRLDFNGMGIYAGTGPNQITTGAGKIKAGNLNNEAWAAPGVIGGTTPSSATFTNVKVNTGGTTITQIRVFTPSLTPASVAANTTATQTFTVTGLAPGNDTVFVNPPSVVNGLGLCECRVSGTNQLALTWVNATAGALTPASGNYRVVAIRS